MAVQRRILTSFFLLAISFSLACGGSSSGTSPNQQAQAALSIALKPAPTTTTVFVGSTGIVFTPVVTNDPANAGVDWAVTCSLTTAGACGTLNITNFHSASGTAVTYIPPAYFFTGSLSVNVTAFAAGDHTKNVITPVTVTSYANALKGTYVLQIQGTDGNSNPYESTGVFVLDGNGNVTSGQQTLNSVTNFSTTYTVQPSSVAASTYFVGPDGRGYLTLNLEQNGTSNTNQETFSFTVISSAQALIAELDLTSLSTGSGTLELQDSTAAATIPTGAYAFVARGTDAGAANGPGGGSPVPTAMGGVFNIDNNPSPGSIDGNGSLADQDYWGPLNASHKLLGCAPPTGVTGTVSQPVSPGIVTIILTEPTGTTCFGQSTIQFTGYIVDATHIKLIESDDSAGNSGYLTAGMAVSQGSAAGTFTVASLMGSYVFGVLGYDILGGAVAASFNSAGVTVADGTGQISGISDTFGAFSGFGLADSTLSGNYTADYPDLNVFGRLEYIPKFSGLLASGYVATDIHLLFYLTGNGTPPLLLWSQGEDQNYPAIATGIAYPQAANPSTFSFGNQGTYGFELTQNPSATEIDSSGVMLTSENGIAGSITGTIEDINDTNLSSGATAPQSLVDSFTLPADDFGRIAGTFRNVAGTAGPYFDYFLVDDNSGFMIETDDTPTIGSGQVSLGYFAQSCDVTVTDSTKPNYCGTAATGSSRSRSLRKPSSGRLRKHTNIAAH